MYEISNPAYKRGIMIKHKGLPLYAGDTLLTPHTFVWWWPVNWFWFAVNIWKLPIAIYKEFKSR